MRIEDLASVYEDLFGSNYFKIDVNASIDYTIPQTQCVIFPTRRPFAINGLNAETIELAFEIYMNVGNVNTKNDMLNAINNVIGFKHGEFTSEDIVYTYDSFLNFSRPLSAPMVDTGMLMQMVQLVGSVYISSKTNGVKMSNDVRTYLTINNVREEIFVSSASIGNVRDSELPTKINNNEASGIVKTQSVTRTLNFFDMRSTFCDNLEKLIEVSDNTTLLNIPVTIERVYPNHTITKESVITNAQIIETKGAFLLFSLTLQKK